MLMLAKFGQLIFNAVPHGFPNLFKKLTSGINCLFFELKI